MSAPPTVTAPGSAELFPASFAQKRLWFLERLVPDTGTYNVPLALRVKGRLDLDALEAALRSLVARHESLRTTFVEVDGEPVQVVHPSSVFEIQRCDLGGSLKFSAKRTTAVEFSQFR